MSRTALKKAVLFVLVLVLAVVFVLQLSLNGRTKVSTLALKKDFNLVTIENKSGNMALEKVDGKWKISYMENPDVKYSTEDYAVENIVDSLKELRLLGSVSNGNAGRLQRYGLDAESRISVKVYEKEKLLRTVYIGKNSGAGSQSYVQVDNKKSVMVADSALHTVFDRTLPSLREKMLYEIPSDSISFVRVKKGTSEYEIILGEVGTTGMEDGLVTNRRTEWRISKSPEDMVDSVLDQGTVGAWIASLSKLEISKWCEPDVALPEGEPDIILDIAVGGRLYSISMYGQEGGEYLCESNQTEGFFYISKKSGDDFAKNLNDLVVKFEVPTEVASE